jgi:periplasmic copper chaperone A
MRRSFLPLAAAAALTVISIATMAAEAGGSSHGSHNMPAMSQAVTAGDLTITGAWARAMLPGQPTGGGYLTITNKGGASDRLVSVASESAGMVEVHSMETADNVMVMRPVEGGLEIPPGATVELKPGGLHLMFMSVKAPFKAGTSVAVTFKFEKAGAVQVTLPVQAKEGAGEHAGHGG